MKNILIGLGLCLCVLFIFPFQLHAGTPLTAIETQVDKVLAVLREPALKAEAAKDARKDKVWALISELFDYTELSRRALGRNWKKLDGNQKKEFTDLFSRLLGGVYLDRIMAYSDEKVTFKKETLFNKNYAQVQTAVAAKSGDIPIQYSMILKDGNWRVFDVIIEGVSLVRNYRTQFREILQNNTPEQLIEILRKKVKNT
ncbi:MAG: ABC transporter substrate-binding protein [Desulfatiglandaceae bacterium]